MIRRFWIFCAILLALCGPPACASGESAESPMVCSEGRTGCLVLQMVMQGSFSEFDSGDSLNGRVLSAALPSLCAVTEEEMQHFREEFAVEEESLRRGYYAAVGNCLWAEILFGDDADGETEAIHSVLLLFLDPSAHENAQEQMDAIREEISDALIERMVQATGTPVGFVRDLIFGEALQAEEPAEPAGAQP